jgi:transposase-like protein
METTVGNIRRATRKKYTVEEKVRIVLAELQRESTIAKLSLKKSP